MFSTTKICTFIATLAVTSLALVAASPANAIYRSYEPSVGDAPVHERTAEVATAPVDKDGNKSCWAGSAGWKDHGSYVLIVVMHPDGSQATYQKICSDGQWIYVLLSSTNPEPGSYSYAADGGYYAEP